MNPEQELAELDRQWVEHCEETEQSMVRGHQRALWLLAAMLTGFGLVMLGLWMNALGENVRLERLLQPWVIVSVSLGVLLVLGSLALIIRNGRRLRAGNVKRLEYELRRDELLRAIHGKAE